jgi:hypothetical protein
MALPPPAGWTRFRVKSKFGAGRDFAALDPAMEEQRYFVDGKIGPRPTAEVRAGSDEVVYRVRGTLVGFPKHITITDATRADVASLKAKMFSPIKSRMTMQTRTGMIGSSKARSWRRTLAEEIDPGLALAVLWSVDRWTESD